MKKIAYLDLVEEYQTQPTNMKNIALAGKMVKEFKKRMKVENVKFVNETGYTSILSNLLEDYDQKLITLLIGSMGHGIRYLTLQIDERV